MAYKVEIAPLANKDLKEILDYLEELTNELGCIIDAVQALFLSLLYEWKEKKESPQDGDSWNR